MCLGLPGRVVETFVDADGVAMAKVSFADHPRNVCLHYLPATTAGDYVLVHLGFAISRLEDDEVRDLKAQLAEIERAAETA